MMNTLPLLCKSALHTFDEILFDVQFVKMFHRDDKNHRTILDLDKLSKTEPCPA